MTIKKADIKYYLIITLFLFSSINIFAQNFGVLKGTIIDNDNDPMCFANVMLKQNGKIINGASTKLDGSYFIDSIDIGKYDIEVRELGYNTAMASNIDINTSDTTILNFTLTIEDIKSNLIADIDTLKINAIEITTLDFKFLIILNNHLKEMRKRLIYNKKKYLISAFIDIVIVMPKNIQDSLYKYNIIDSIYKFNKFKENDYEYTYYICVNFAKKETKNDYHLSHYKNYYYYNYNGWDVVFYTNLNIEFPNIEQKKVISIIVENENFTLYDKYTYTYIEKKMNLFNKIYKYFRDYEFCTIYYLGNFSVTNIKYNDLYNLSSKITTNGQYYYKRRKIK